MDTRHFGPMASRRDSRARRRNGFVGGIILGIVTGGVLGACMEDSTTSHAQDAGHLDSGSSDAMHPADAGYADTGHGGGHPADASLDAGAPYGCTIPLTNATDVQFIDMMVPHHQMATMMAEQVLARGSRADVKAFAQKAKDDQTREIAQMKTARKELTGSDAVPPPPPDSHMDAEMAMMMQMSGAELDRMFLEDMIPHHAGAISVAHRAKYSLQRPDMKDLAKMIFDMQSKEIGELHAMLDQP
jgi:uncharacterized protein (DUF305 family)